ncbi:MAG: ABC transporter ATP-binding protein [Candidatus Hodarchaeales archaeon]
MSLVSVKELYKTFKIPRGEDIRVLNGISLEVSEGEFIAIMGPSGSGKSTLLNILASIEDFDKGKVIVHGQDLDKADIIYTRRFISSIIYQDFNLLPYLTALENVMFPMMISGMEEKKASSKAKQLLERVGLGNRINHNPDDLSGGEQQRVAIARALANEPKVILADEPTGNLDSKTGDLIIELFKELIQEKKISVIIVTHDYNIAKKTDRILILREGKLHREEEILEEL